MKQRVIYLPSQYQTFDKGSLRDHACFVIDVLRATSSHISALANGAPGIYPVETIPEALDLKQKNPDWILAGERGGIRPEGFEIGNSPIDFANPPRKYQPLISTTTNGTRAYLACRRAGAQIVMAAALLNLSAVIKKCKALDCPILIVCAGTGPDFSMEDAFVAGAIMNEMKPQSPWGALYRAYAKEPLSLLKSSKNGQALIKLGLEKDIEDCGQIDQYDVIPEMDSTGMLVLRETI